MCRYLRVYLPSTPTVAENPIRISNISDKANDKKSSFIIEITRESYDPLDVLVLMLKDDEGNVKIVQGTDSLPKSVENAAFQLIVSGIKTARWDDISVIAGKALKRLITTGWKGQTFSRRHYNSFMEHFEIVEDFVLSLTTPPEQIIGPT